MAALIQRNEKVTISGPLWEATATFVRLEPGSEKPTRGGTAIFGTAHLADREPAPLPEAWAPPEGPAVPMTLVGAGLGLYGLRALRVVDRDDERALMWRTLGEVTSEGATRLLLLHGGAGNGKSRLAEWLVQRAQEVGGAEVLRALHGLHGARPP